MRVVAYAAWFVAPWPALRIGEGRIGTYLFLVLALMSLAIASRRGSFGLNKTSRIVVLVTCAMVVGMAGGELQGGGNAADFVRLGLYLIGAVAPIMAINALEDRDRTVRHLGLSFLFGTLLSLAFVSFPTSSSFLPPEFRFVGHKNQLAATLGHRLASSGAGEGAKLTGHSRATAVDRHCPPRRLERRTSRSGLVAAVVMALLVALLVRPRRQLWVRAAVGGAFTLVVAAIASNDLGSLIADITSSGSLARAAGEVNTNRSDEVRSQLLSTGFDAVDFRTALFGQGFALDRQPHNVFLGMWVAGGLLAGLGLVAILVLALRAFIREAHDPHRGDVYLLVFSLSVVGYCVVAFFNVLLWVPYAWAIIALFAASEDRRGTPMPHFQSAEQHRTFAPGSSSP